MRFKYKVEATARNGNKVVVGSFDSLKNAIDKLEETKANGMYISIRIIDLEAYKAIITDDLI